MTQRACLFLLVAFLYNGRKKLVVSFEQMFLKCLQGIPENTSKHATHPAPHRQSLEDHSVVPFH